MAASGSSHLGFVMRLGSSHVVFGALLSAVLVVTVVAPVAADEVEPVPFDVPPLVSEPLAPTVTAWPEGDFDLGAPVEVAPLSKSVGRDRPEVAAPAKGDHYHVDFYNGKGEVVHTIHFRWRMR